MIDYQCLKFKKEEFVHKQFKLEIDYKNVKLLDNHFCVIPLSVSEIKITFNSFLLHSHHPTNFQFNNSPTMEVITSRLGKKNNSVSLKDGTLVSFTPSDITYKIIPGFLFFILV